MDEEKLVRIYVCVWRGERTSSPPKEESFKEHALHTYVTFIPIPAY